MEEETLMKKMLSVLLAAMMLLMAVPALAEGNQVLTVVTWDATTTPYLVAQKEAFEASHPGVTIEYVDCESGNEYGVKVSTMLAGGDTSDVIMLKENDQVVQWQASGFAAPLTTTSEATICPVL